MNRMVEGKYFPLQNYLKNKSDTHIILSFDEIEAILNAPLPSSAYNYQAWWVNSTKAHTHSSTWLDVGFVVGQVRFGETVEFIKKVDTDIQIVQEKAIYQETISDGLSKEEVDYIQNLSEKMENIREFFANDAITGLSKGNLSVQYETIKRFRRIIGNIDNDISFIGCLLVKEFINNRYDITGLNMGLKAQGASGLDFDEVTVDGKRIVGELKTTYPYQKHDLGANQKSTFIKDFEKLQNNVADHKYFFVTEQKTFEIVRTKYSQYLQGVSLVLLPQAITNSECIITY
jgi:hypothetical protein